MASPCPCHLIVFSCNTEEWLKWWIVILFWNIWNTNSTCSFELYLPCFESVIPSSTGIHGCSWEVCKRQLKPHPALQQKPTIIRQFWYRVHIWPQLNHSPAGGINLILSRFLQYVVVSSIASGESQVAPSETSTHPWKAVCITCCLLLLFLVVYRKSLEQHTLG